MQDPLSRRVMARLWSAEVREVNPHYQADIRIAWITVLLASRGELEPSVSATYAVLGKHPRDVWPAILARRHALLGRDYPLFYDAAGNWKPEPLADPWAGQSPRKPVQSVLVFPPQTDEVA